MENYSFSFDAKTARLLDELQKVFGVQTHGQVIRRALGLARWVSRQAGEDRVLTVKKPDGEEVLLLLAE